MSYKVVKDLFNSGEFDKALAMFNLLPPQDILRSLFIKASILLARGNFTDAYVLATEVYQKGKTVNDQVAVLGAIWVKLYIYLFGGKFTEFVEAVKEIDDYSGLDGLPPDDQIEVQERIVLLYEIRAAKEMHTGNYEKGVELGKKGLAIGEDIGSPVAIIWSLYIISANYQHMEAISLGIEYANRGIEISKQNNTLHIVCMIYLTLGRLYKLKGDMINSLVNYQQALAISKESDFRLAFDLATAELGHQLVAIGDYEQAIEHYKYGIDSARARNDQFVVAKRLNELGSIYRIKGELSLATSVFEEFLDVSRALDNDFYQSRAYHALGTIKQDQGYYLQALEYFQKSFSLLSVKLENSLSASNTLLTLVHTNIETGNATEAERYLVKLNDISKTTDNHKIKTNYLLAKALILKNSTRMKNKIKSQEIFETIAENAVNEHSIITFSLLNVCELLIYEYKSTGEKEIFNEINDLSQLLYSMGREKNAYPTIVKALLLQVKLSLIEGNLVQLESRLDEALQLANKEGLGSLLTQINHEQQHVKAELDKWKALLASKSTIQERISVAALDTYIKTVRRMINLEGEKALDS
ncbi:MAG: tetratricopeptide repeat protein [Candidatus Hodarchaeales archaeon]|jgi:tetratricopeptide (TPR) repeat protein